MNFFIKITEVVYVWKELSLKIYSKNKSFQTENAINSKILFIKVWEMLSIYRLQHFLKL